MSEQDPELEAFSKFIATLDPWLGEVVQELYERVWQFPLVNST
ncbi:MAG TPA: hypothetical protein VMO76_14870 [Candidatus Udaeobacter sp.]|jgi:hypothetical protein|nr:hypothetical protein [Candidatus Udaeobacter sp.]